MLSAIEAKSFSSRNTMAATEEEKILTTHIAFFCLTSRIRKMMPVTKVNISNQFSDRYLKTLSIANMV